MHKKVLFQQSVVFHRDIEKFKGLEEMCIVFTEANKDKHLRLNDNLNKRNYTSDKSKAHFRYYNYKQR